MKGGVQSNSNTGLTLNKVNAASKEQSKIHYDQLNDDEFIIESLNKVPKQDGQKFVKSKLSSHKD